MVHSILQTHWIRTLTCNFSALLCNARGTFLPKYAQPAAPLNDDSLYKPFENCLAFDWAHYHFVELQSSKRKAHKGPDLWMAMRLKSGNNSLLPWALALQMYEIIDKIQAGDAPFTTVKF